MWVLAGLRVVRVKLGRQIYVTNCAVISIMKGEMTKMPVEVGERMVKAGLQAVRIQVQMMARKSWI